MIRHILIATSALVALAQAAHADGDRWPKWYLALHGEVPFVPDSDLEQGGASLGDVAFDTGWGGGAALGYMPSGGNTNNLDSLWDAFRLEFEYSHRVNDVDAISTRSGPSTGEAKVNAYMANIFYDFNSDTAIKPYLGLGLGSANINLESSLLGVDDDDMVFAYQVLAGLYYEPDLMPYTQWGMGYRFFDTTDPVVGAGASATEFDYMSHGVEFGARFRF